MTADPETIEQTQTPASTGRSRVFRAIRHREFRVIWGTFTVGQFGFWVSFISMQSLMVRLTDASGTWLGLLFFINFIPMLVFTPIAGVVADRSERKRILQTTYSLLCLVMAGLAAVTLAGHATPAVVLPFAFCVGTLFAFNAPTSQAIVANAVPGDDLPSAISLQSTGANLARVLGPTMAAPVLAIWNEGAAFLIYAITCAIVVLMLGRLHVSAHRQEENAGHFLRRLRRGFQHARERPPALTLLSVMAMSSLFAAAYLSMIPLMATKVFHRGPAGFATLAAVAGIGSVFGALTTGFREHAPTLRGSALLVACFGVSIAVFGQAPTWTVALPASVVTGFFYFSGMTTLNTLLQYLADDTMRGRMSSLFVICWAGLVPIGGLWQGIFASAHGVRLTMLISGCVTAGYALCMVAAITLGLVKDRRPVVRIRGHTFLPSEAP